jgi:hypothetical protein
MDLQTLIGSAVVAAAISASISGFVSLRTSARNINVEHVTRERAKWRDKVRDKALEVHRAIRSADADELAALHLQFALILNPLDAEDRRILRLMDQLPVDQGTDAVFQELADRLALLLKHDWERAKREAAPVVSLRGRGATRVTYEELLRRRRAS